MEEKTARRRGRPPKTDAPKVEAFNITLPPGLGEWAKSQPEGLSGLIRDCLLEKKRERDEVTTEETS